MRDPMLWRSPCIITRNCDSFFPTVIQQRFSVHGTFKTSQSIPSLYRISKNLLIDTEKQLSVMPTITSNIQRIEIPISRQSSETWSPKQHSPTSSYDETLFDFHPAGSNPSSPARLNSTAAVKLVNGSQKQTQPPLSPTQAASAAHYNQLHQSINTLKGHIHPIDSLHNHHQENSGPCTRRRTMDMYSVYAVDPTRF
ncbi:hypothetical protein BJ742DRAFT_440044 [Cladochytrium replicatum]|nr:hypothetical protein BJ742DRAFT_440044 [Cladochytrium replicatum]